MFLLAFYWILFEFCRIGMDCFFFSKKVRNTKKDRRIFYTKGKKKLEECRRKWNIRRKGFDGDEEGFFITLMFYKIQGKVENKFV